MKGVSALDQRMIRVNAIVKTLKESKENFNFIIYDKLVFEIQMRYGLTESKAREYIDLAMKTFNAKISEEGEIVFLEEKDGT